MKRKPDAFYIATIHDQKNGRYEVEMDGQQLNTFTNEKEAREFAELLAFVFDVGYEAKEREYDDITEEDTYFPFELPDNFRFKNNFSPWDNNR